MGKGGGRKVRALELVMSLSLVSWRQQTVGEADTTASRTTSHLSGSPRPRTFQDITKRERKALLLIDKTHKHRESTGGNRLEQPTWPTRHT